MSLPPKPNREQPVPALKLPARLMRPHSIRIQSASGSHNAESMQSESDLRATGLPPKRPAIKPSAHGQTSSALDKPSGSSRLSPQEKVLVRWELFSQPAISDLSPADRARANRAWDWASSLGGESPRWKRFLRVVRSRALGYRRAGYGGDCPLKAMDDVAQCIDAVSPIKDVWI